MPWSRLRPEFRGFKAPLFINSSCKSELLELLLMIVGIYFPKVLLEKLDRIRGDVPRSKYIQRLVEKSLQIEGRPR